MHFFAPDLTACFQEWTIHPRYSAEFQGLLEKITEEFGPLIAEKDRSKNTENGRDNGSGDSKPVRKRKNQAQDVMMTNPIAAKRGKVENAFLKKIEEVGEENKLLEFDLVNRGGGISVHVKFQNKVFLFNRSHTKAVLQAGHVLAGFGSGKYKQRKEGEEFNADKEVLFEVDPATLVLNGSQLTTVDEMLKTKRADDPTASIAYHKVIEEPTPEDASKIKITLQNQVAFVPNPAGVNEDEENKEKSVKAKALQARAASLLPAASWKTHCTSVLWAVRWAAIGLTPVKPQVVLTKEISLEPGQACEL